MTLKKRVVATFEDSSSPYFSLVNDVLAIVTIISIFVVVIETVSSLSPYKYLFLTIEWFTVILFTLEYLARLWVAKPKKKYYLGFFGIVDLLAILPGPR